jgi:hypothetical protein
LGGFIRIWGGLLNIPQIVGGLMFVTHLEGVVVLLTAFVTLVVAGQIHKATPFSRLTGLCYLPWFVLLPWLLGRLFTYDYSAVQTGWMIYVAATIAISLLFDVYDLVRFVQGDRRFAWAGQNPQS